jgi:hypothetical protein
LILALTSGSAQAVEAVPGITGKIAGAAGAALLQAYTIGFRYVWITSACFCIVVTIGKTLVACHLFID